MGHAALSLPQWTGGRTQGRRLQKQHQSMTARIDPVFLHTNAEYECATLFSDS
jgi:hypothetical protein